MQFVKLLVLKLIYVSSNDREVSATNLNTISAILEHFDLDFMHGNSQMNSKWIRQTLGINFGSSSTLF
jgi:hypothetical protein